MCMFFQDYFMSYDVKGPKYTVEERTYASKMTLSFSQSTEFFCVKGAGDDMTTTPAEAELQKNKIRV